MYLRYYGMVCTVFQKDLYKSKVVFSISYRVTFLRRGVFIPSPNPLPGGPPPVVCPLLLIQHIRRCLPYLHVVSSIRDLRTRHALVAGTHLPRNSWGVVYWIDLAQDRDRWRALVNEILNSRAP